MIRYELRKIWRNRLLWGFLAAFLLLNGLQIWQTASMMRGRDKEMNRVRHMLYTQVRGAWSQEKLQFVIEEQKRLQAIVESGNFSTEPNQPNTYCGYVFGDFGLFTELYTGMDAMYHYASGMEARLEQARENVAFFSERGNLYDVRKNKQILKIYGNRHVDAYYRTEGAEAWIHHPFSSLMMLLSVLLCIAPVFAGEVTTGMEALLRTTRNGGMRLRLAKMAAAILSTAGIVLLFALCDGLCFAGMLDMDCLGNSLYSITAFRDTPFSGTVGQFLCLLYGCRLLGMLCFSSLVLAFSRLTGNEIWVAVLSATALACCMAAGSAWNPLMLMTMGEPFTGYDCMPVLGYPVLQPMVRIAGGELLALVLTAAVLFVPERGGQP